MTKDDLIKTGYTEDELRKARRRFVERHGFVPSTTALFDELKRPTEPWYTKLPGNTPFEGRRKRLWLLWYAQGDHVSACRDDMGRTLKWDELDDIRMPEHERWHDGLTHVVVRDDGSYRATEYSESVDYTADIIHIYRRSDHQ